MSVGSEVVHSECHKQFLVQVVEVCGEGECFDICIKVSGRGDHPS